MDLSQKKLSKSEWLNVEIMVPNEEKSILKLIIDGYHNVNLRHNNTQSLMATMKLVNTAEIEQQLYNQYFDQPIQDLLNEYSDIFDLPDQINAHVPKFKKQVSLKKRDLIRINSMNKNIAQQKDKIFEFILLELCEEILKSLDAENNRYAYYLYTLIQLQKVTISHINSKVIEFVNTIINIASNAIQMRDVLRQAYDFIEKNPYILKYEDRTLYNHQKELFTIFKHSPASPKLVLYTAPTGTGKTLSPLGLSEGHRVIFICAARHIGLALAKSAVSMKKRIAVAFGCETASDIRLHYYSASEYTINKRSGGIGKVDNSVGDKVEIMICDVQSYLIAMYYMLAFSPKSDENTDNGTTADDADLITYWDEPTITMDYDEHPLHELIHRNWTDNRISKVVLSCATLPKDTELLDTIADFKVRFSGAEIHTITSFDCRKSISLLNKSGKSVVPHLLFRNYAELRECVNYCDENKTLLRYFDLKEVVELIELAHSGTTDNILMDMNYNMETYFSGGISDITMNSIKMYYLDVLKHVVQNKWPEMHDILLQNQQSKYKPTDEMIRKTRSLDAGNSTNNGSDRMSLAGHALSRCQSVSLSPTMPTMPTMQNVFVNSSTSSNNNNNNSGSSGGILLTTQDAHTLTDGPTIFITEDVEKVGRFYIQQSKIPERIFNLVSEKIAQNSDLQRKIDILCKTLDDKLGGEENKEQSKNADTEKSGGGNKGKSRKLEKGPSVEIDTSIVLIQSQIDALTAQIKVVSLENAYIPNTITHQHIWVSNSDDIIKNAFIPIVDKESVCDIMALAVTDQMKLLLLMGIGMFVNEQSSNPRYMEIMKRLAYNQQLFLILASSDYIYGTNYQFCHGFIGKDLNKMTYQKTIQAMGRIGRNNIQQEYTVRFRDDAILTQLFRKSEQNTEAVIMSRLFSE